MPEVLLKALYLVVPIGLIIIWIVLVAKASRRTLKIQAEVEKGLAALHGAPVTVAELKEHCIKNGKAPYWHHPITDHDVRCALDRLENLRGAEQVESAENGPLWRHVPEMRSGVVTA